MTGRSRRRNTAVQLTAPTDLSRHFSAAAAVAALLHPHAEVVVHDLRTDSVAGIWNAFSNRVVGDPSNLRNDEELAIDQEIYGPYEKAQPNGNRVKSVSAALLDDKSITVGLMCINLDMSRFDQAIELLKAFTSPTPPMPTILLQNDVREQINLAIMNACSQVGKRVEALEKYERIDVIRDLDQKGVFNTRNAVPIVAQALGLSRASIYKIIRDARSN